MWLRGLKCLDRVRRPCIWGWDGRRGAGAAEEYFTMLDFHITKKGYLRLAAVLAVAISANACSSLPDMPDVPDWVDPTTWFGDDSTTPVQPDNGQTAAAQQDNGQAAAQQQANGQPPATQQDNAKTPDLASLPEKPTASSAADQQQVAEFSCRRPRPCEIQFRVLRGGTEAAAAPPPDVAPAQVASSLGNDAVPPAKANRPKALRRRSRSAPHVDQSVAQAPSGPAIPGSFAVSGPGNASREPSRTRASAARRRPRRRAHSRQFRRRRPFPQPTGSINPSDAALGFKPSHAPPLDPSVSQFVAPPILQHYQSTAAGAGLRSGSPVAVHPPPTGLHKPHGATKGMGGPETMTGAVVANLDALQPPSSTPSVYASPQGMPATAVVFFPGDTVSLNAEAREQVKAAAEQYKANGGQGFVRVVGHSSSRTPNMPVERHLEAIFAKSQERANAVAQELIRDGVPAAKVLVEAVGDSQPVYYESMPKGEDGNRRAEIFLQG